MKFSSDVKAAMKTCIMSLIWARQDILSFFRDHDCTRQELTAIAKFKERQLSRGAMIDTVFERLDARMDNGIGPYRAMLQSLIDWDYFDPYSFDKLKKLDRRTARECIDDLRRLHSRRDSGIREQARIRRAARDKQQYPKKSPKELLDEFLKLHAGTLNPQARGYAFEKILTELAKSDSLETTESFRVCGEQIDGAIKYDGEHYLVEAKWQNVSSTNESVYQFAAKIEGKMYGRGLLFSVQGFSRNVIEAIVKGKAIKTIFIDGEDIVLVLEGHVSFREMIDAKVKAAQTRGLIYTHPISASQKKGTS